ncbi:MAG TPA: BtrH N-terminal domain-containing protein [bacterium]
MARAFDHRHSGHCETGALSALLRDRGLDLSEPMVFGLGGGVFFVHAPFVRVGGVPLTAYRDAPGAIVRRVCARLGIRMRTHRFRSESQGEEKLDALLAAGNSVGLRASVYCLPYFPREMRFRFNAHHLVVFDREGGEYLVSDPVFDHVERCPAADLARARFAKGLFAPRGLLFYPERIPRDFDLDRAVRKSIRFTCRRMTATLPFIGVRGIRYLARRMRRWPAKQDYADAVLNVGTVVRMQEEIGTGGAGFRFMYAAFLQEAAEVTGLPALRDEGRAMAETGDRWRDFAVQGARLCKGHVRGDAAFDELAAMLVECADREEGLYRRLLTIVR